MRSFSESGDVSLILGLRTEAKYASGRKSRHDTEIFRIGYHRLTETLFGGAKRNDDTNICNQSYKPALPVTLYSVELSSDRHRRHLQCWIQVHSY